LLIMMKLLRVVERRVDFLSCGRILADEQVM
jgi:hypothetical protein